MFVPGGLGRSGGVRPVARRLVSVIEAARGSGTRALALLDHDEMGRRIAEALDRLGAQKGKDYLLLDRADFPIRGFNGVPNIEIEDLVSRRLLELFVASHPEAVEEKLDRGADGIRFAWRGSSKGDLIQFAREQGTLQDFERLVRLIGRIRACFAGRAG